MSKNRTTKILSGGREVCLSYNVPVAAFVPGLGYIKTDRRYSQTTSKHANQFCGGRPVIVSDDEFNKLIADEVL